MRRRCDLLRNADWEVIGQNVCEHREDKGMSQTALGKVIGVSHQMISKIENGKMKKSPISYGMKLEKIAGALECDLEDLIISR